MEINYKDLSELQDKNIQMLEKEVIRLREVNRELMKALRLINITYSVRRGDGTYFLNVHTTSEVRTLLNKIKSGAVPE